MNVDGKKLVDLRIVIAEKSDVEIVELYGDVLELLASDLGIVPDEDQLVTAQRIRIKLKSIDV